MFIISTRKKWLSTKNRSPLCSTPRHPILSKDPIDMASTAKPPDPMSCALSAVLFPESRAHGYHMEKTLFPGPAPHARGGVRDRPVPACRVRSCAGRASWCLSAVRSRACVDAWAGAASGGSFRSVTPVVIWGLGLLLRGERVDYGNSPDNAYSQGVQELNASAGAC